MNPEAKKPYDATLVHGYYLSQKGDFARVKPSTRSYFAARAGGIALREGLVEILYLKAGKLWGESYPAVAEPMTRVIIEEIGIDPQKINSNNCTAQNTKAEIECYLSQTTSSDLVSIAFKKHFLTIEALCQQKGIKLIPLTVEEIISTYDRPEKQEALNNFLSSKYELNYLFYQWCIKILDRKYRLLDTLGKRHRQRKQLHLPIPWFQIDEYEL